MIDVDAKLTNIILCYAAKKFRGIRHVLWIAFTGLNPL